MDYVTNARQRANLVAKKYLENRQDQPVQKLVSELEDAAYERARGGNSCEANSLFIIVADLSKRLGTNDH